MTERCNDDVAFLWWKYDYDEDDDCDDEKEKKFQPYFQQNCEMVVVASFSGSVRLIFILPTTEPTLWYYSAYKLTG